MPRQSALDIINSKDKPTPVLYASQHEYTFTARFGGSFQPWMRIFEVDGKHYLTNASGIEDSIIEHGLTHYYQPGPDGRLMKVDVAK